MAEFLPRPDVDPIIKQLVIIRESRQYKQSYIASRMRSTQSCISEMERGFLSPKISRVREYAHALNLDIYLGGGDYFPDLEKMDLADLVDLYHLLGEEMERRMGCAMTAESTS